jgi:hypothetical protein
MWGMTWVPEWLPVTGQIQAHCVLIIAALVLLFFPAFFFMPRIHVCGF